MKGHPRPDHAAWQCVLVTALGVGTLVILALGVYGWLYPPAPPVARAFGLDGERYEPDVIGLDASGALFVNDDRYAEPIDGRFDEDALLRRALARKALRTREEHWVQDLLEWQVVSIHREVDLVMAYEFVDTLREAGVPRVCFDLSALGDDAGEGLVHAWRRTIRGVTFCFSGDYEPDPTILVVFVTPLSNEHELRWGYAGMDATVSGTLDMLVEDLRAGSFAAVDVSIDPSAKWSTLLRALDAVERFSGVPYIEFPELGAAPGGPVSDPPLSRQLASVGRAEAR